MFSTEAKMNGRMPSIGQPTPQMMAMGQVVACYSSVLPIVAAAVLNDKDAILEESPRVIADLSWEITLEAMKKIGIKVPELPPEQT